MAAVHPQKDGTVALQLHAKEAGHHFVNVKHNNEAISGSPFNFHVHAANGGFVTTYGNGLTAGTTGEPSSFTVVGVTGGDLNVVVDGPAKVTPTILDNKNNTSTVTWVPTASGTYSLAVKVKGTEIEGSPFVSKVSSEGRKKSQIAVNTCSKIYVNAHEKDITSLQGTITYPSGKSEPCRLTKKEADNQLGFVFSPKEKGKHKLAVTQNDKPIKGSPFEVDFKPEEVAHPEKVQASGKALNQGMARTDNEVIISTKGAGYGVLTLSIEGKQRAAIDNKEKDGTHHCIFTPSEPGNYLLGIKYGEQHITGSPFQVKVEGTPSGKQVEKITSKRMMLPVAEPNRMSELCLKLPGTNPFDMEANITAPSGFTECCEIMDLEDNHYSIRFKPPEKGIHVLGVKHKGMHIVGSPFQYTVGPITETGSHKVRAFGEGVTKGEVKFPCDFNVYTHESGPGDLQISVEGASKAKIDFEERSIPGTVGCCFTVEDPGDYMVSVKWNEVHIPDSPFLVNVTPPLGEVRKVIVQSLTQHGLQVGKPMTFFVKTGGVSGSLSAYAMQPKGEEKDLFIQEQDKGDYGLRFIPEENGAHYLHVLFNGHDIPGSPFWCTVGKSDVDPGKLKASGDGLSKGKTGAKNKFFVNTCNSGAATLDITIEGPSKAQIQNSDKDDGYEITYNVTAPGDYFITIKYAGPFHIAGSPFKAVVSGSGRSTGYKEKAHCVIETVAKVPGKKKGGSFKGLSELKSDASKIQCTGNGIKKGFVNKRSMFKVDTKNAGENILFVAILGANGPAEVDEMTIKRQGRIAYQVSYVIKSKGDYHMIVKWGEDDVPGSPFPLVAQV